jgi:hypothetical protein
VFFIVQQVQTNTGWWQLLVSGGILVSILSAIFLTGRWVGRLGRDVSELRRDVTKLTETTTDAIQGIESRLDPLERDYWIRIGEGRAERRVRRSDGGESAPPLTE